MATMPRMVKLDEAKQKAHEFELDLVRCKAQLEVLIYHPDSSEA